MAVMVTLTGKFVNPDESSALIGTRITFALVPADIPDKVLDETVVPGPVSVPISSGGTFTVTLRATDDPDLTANVDGDLVYRVTRQGITGNYYIALPAPGPWDWSDLVPEPATDATLVAGWPGPPGPPGPAGMIIAATPPAEHDVLWADTATTGVEAGSTVAVFTYTDPADDRPNASVVFWIPDPYTLANPFDALPGDCVLRSTPDVVTGLNGVAALWQGTAAEYAALTPDADTVYFVLEDPLP